MSHTLIWTDTPTGRTGRRTAWAVAAFDGHGRTLYATHPLDYADIARRWYGHLTSQPRTDRVEITEIATVLTERRIGLEQLPVPGALVDLPLVPDGAHSIKRFYCFNVGPRVLRTPEDVRDYHHWLRGQQEGGQPNAMRVCLATLELFEVTLVRYEQPIPLADVPE